jgi:hypothetical protein
VARATAVAKVARATAVAKVTRATAVAKVARATTGVKKVMKVVHGTNVAKERHECDVCDHHCLRMPGSPLLPLCASEKWDQNGVHWPRKMRQTKI